MPLRITALHQGRRLELSNEHGKATITINEDVDGRVTMKITREGNLESLTTTTTLISDYPVAP